MMTNNLIWSVLLFFIQPVFIVGLIYVVMNYQKRINYMRKHFRVNFVRENFELKDFLLKGIIPGLIVSVISVLIGIPLSIEWYITYQAIAILFLLIGGYRLIHPVFTFTLTSISLYLFETFNIELPFNRLNNLFNQSFYSFQLSELNLSFLSRNGLLLVTLILFATVILIKNNDFHKIYPILRTSKRGKAVAKYQKKSLWLLPLMIVVPGEVFEGFADWWPLLNINGNSYAFLLMPVLAGFHFTVSTQLVEDATDQIKKEFLTVAGLGIVAFAAAYFVPAISVGAALILLILGMVVLIRHRRRENQWSFRYGPTNEGVRVIAVRADSPAERMNLSIGDIILNINDQEMVDKESYNTVIAYNRSYIKMRIRRTDGEIVITETPLYDNDYNNLGLLILEN